MYSRKLYVAVAKIVADNARIGTVWGWTPAETQKDIARDLADLFANDNPNFDRARFLDACGVEG